MTTHPEQPNPPTDEAQPLEAADAWIDHETWFGRATSDQVSREPVVFLFENEQGDTYGTASTRRHQ